MADDGIDYSAYAGHVAFPRNPSDLLSTSNCPACFASLKSTVCSTCGLDLGHPDAAKLYDTSVVAARTLDERLAIIGKMRYDAMQANLAAPTVSIREPADANSLLNQRRSEAASVAPPVVAPAVPQPVVSIDDRSPGRASALASQGRPEMAFPHSSSALNQREVETTTPRRSSVQVTLLIVGVSLISIAAIFFLVYAFINFGVVWRSLIIGAITVAAIVGASLLRRRKLTATAEGIAAFAVVLVYLDVWAIRANNLFGASATDATLYWGVAVVLAAVGFIAWHRMSGLRMASIVGFATFAPAVGVLVSGLAEPHMTWVNRAFLTATAIVAAGLIHPLARHGGKPALPERIVILATTALTLLAALVLAVGIYERFEWASAIGVAGLAVLAGMHVVVLVKSPSAVSAAFGHFFAVFAGFSAASAIGITILREGNDDSITIVPAVSAAVVALILEFYFRRLSPAALRPFAATATVGAAVVAGLALLPAAIATVGNAAQTALSGIRNTWDLGVTDPVIVSGTGTIWPILALAIVGALVALAWWIGRVLPARNIVIAWWTALVLVLAVPSLRILWLDFGAWMLIAIASFAVLILLQGKTGATRYRPVLTTTMIVAAALGYGVGWATTTTWWIGTLIVIGLIIASRAIVKSPGAKAALLGSGIGLALLSVGSVADQLTLHTNFGLEVGLADRFVLTSIAAAVVLLGAAIPDGAASALDRRVEFWVAGAASAVSLPIATILVTRMPASSRAALLLPEYWTSLAAALVLLASLTLWIGLRRNQALRPERIVASIAVGPTLYLGVSAFARLLALPEFAMHVVPVTAAVLASAGSLTITTMRPATPGRTATPRWTRELGVALVGVPAVLAAIRTDDGLTWLVLLLAAIAALLLAIDRDGLFSSRSPRHHLGWVALALATAGLWWRLNGDRVTDLEFYVVPLSLALLSIAVLIAITARRETPVRNSAAAPPIALGGLLVSILPLGTNAATASTTYALWLFALCAVLLIGGSAVVGNTPWRRFADACALAGAIGVIVISVGRTPGLPLEAPERDGWLAAAFLILVASGFLQARTRTADNQRLRSIGSQALGLIAMTALLVLELPAITDTATGSIRALTLVLLFCAIHVIAFPVSHPPLTRLMALVAIAYAAIIGVTGVLLHALDVVELASIPIALALLVTGVTHLASAPAARSWPWLGPGTAVLLVSSLLATADERPLWRLVGLGIVGITVIVVGVVRRLQAPFTIGVVVVLIHGIATFLPQLRAAYEFLPWWLWLGAGGALLIVLAARYEQRIRNLKDVALKYAALR